MFPNADPSTALELHRQKVAKMIREAADHELVRSASAGRNRRLGRWRRRQGRGRGSHATAAA